MEVRVQEEAGRGFRVHRVFGRVTLDELLVTLPPLLVEPSEGYPADALWDFTQADLALSFEEVERLAELTGHHWGPSKGSRAAIVAGDDLGFGLARVYAARITPRVDRDVRIFRGREAAIRWLDAGGVERSTHDGE